MLNLKQALAEDIAAGIAAAQKAGDLTADLKIPEIVVKHSDSEERGDYASPVALALAKQTKKPPLDIVAAIAEHMPKKEYVGKLEGAAPGFLNIRINPGWYVARLDDVLEQDVCVGMAAGGGRRFNFEFISANPTGPLTLGNARTAFSVDTLANVLACAGHTVTREYYINDAGVQIKKLGESVLRRILELQGEKVEYGEELYQGDYIKEVAAEVAERWRETEGKQFSPEDLNDAALVEKISREAAAYLLGQIKHTVENDLKIRFDVWSSETALRGSGKIEAVLERLRKGGHTYKKDGKEYLKTTAWGDSEDRVLVKSNGEYAYILPDIAYHQEKYERGFDEMFTFVGADHQGHGPKLVAAMRALGNDVTKLHVVAAQWMRFVSGGKPVKLSKRRGHIVTPQELLDEVGYDAARFFMVQHALTTHMDFDLDLAREKSERNPVYYAQYAYVRLQSIIRRAKEAGVIDSIGETVVLTSRAPLTHTAELNVLRTLYRLPEVLDDIVATREVQTLAYYALELAKKIHFFYRHTPVLAADDKLLTASRLQLVMAARKVLGEALALLGLNQPDVM